MRTWVECVCRHSGAFDCAEALAGLWLGWRCWLDPRQGWLDRGARAAWGSGRDRSGWLGRLQSWLGRRGRGAEVRIEAQVRIGVYGFRVRVALETLGWRLRRGAEVGIGAAGWAGYRAS